MVEGIVVGVVVTVTVAVLARLAGIFDAPRRARECATAWNRARKDYSIWVARNNRELQEELGRIDEDLNAKGMFHSGLRLQLHVAARTRSVEDVQDEARKTLRLMDDAYGKLRPVDRAWFAFTTPGGRPKGMSWLKALRKAMFGTPASLETEVLDEAIEKIQKSGLLPRQPGREE